MPSLGEKSLTARYLWRWWDFICRRTFSWQWGGTRGQKKGVSQGIFKILDTFLRWETMQTNVAKYKDGWVVKQHSLTCAVDSPDVTEECVQLDPTASGGLEWPASDPANHIIHIQTVLSRDWNLLMHQVSRIQDGMSLRSHQWVCL